MCIFKFMKVVVLSLSVNLFFAGDVFAITLEDEVPEQIVAVAGKKLTLYDENDKKKKAGTVVGRRCQRVDRGKRAARDHWPHEEG